MKPTIKHLLEDKNHLSIHSRQKMNKGARKSFPGSNFKVSCILPQKTTTQSVHKAEIVVSETTSVTDGHGYGVSNGSSLNEVNANPQSPFPKLNVEAAVTALQEKPLETARGMITNSGDENPVEKNLQDQIRDSIAISDQLQKNRSAKKRHSLSKELALLKQDEGVSNIMKEMEGKYKSDRRRTGYIKEMEDRAFPQQKRILDAIAENNAKKTKLSAPDVTEGLPLRNVTSPQVSLVNIWLFKCNLIFFLFVFFFRLSIFPNGWLLLFLWLLPVFLRMLIDKKNLQSVI